MSFSFDDTKSFDDNLNLFLDEMDKDDPEMSAILRANLSTISNAHDDQSRRAARIRFNGAVKVALDALLIEPDEGVVS